MSDTQPTRPARRRPAPALVEVVSVAKLTPRLVSVLVGGADLSRYAEAAPTSHLKLLLPDPGEDAPRLPVVTDEGPVWPEDAPRPTMRTYTPRRFDPAAGTLEIQLLLHGDGPASSWAARAKPGDKVAVAGPGGRFTADLTTPRWWIAGDETAIPAIGTLLDALPAGVVADVHVEVTGPEDELDLPSAADARVTWHHRRSPDAWGTELYDVARAAGLSDGTQAWVACEAAAMRRIRTELLADRSLRPSWLVTRGYWRLGAADHPDHDYGDD